MAQVNVVERVAMMAPHLVTEVPGPRARAHVAYDEAWTSRSLPRAYPLVPVRGSGATIEDIDGNTFVDFAAGIAVNSTGHGHPAVVRAIQEQAQELLHYSASDFYLPIYAETCEAIEGRRPSAGLRGSSWATAARKRWRRVSSWHAGPPAATPSSRSWEASMDARWGRSR